MCVLSQSQFTTELFEYIILRLNFQPIHMTLHTTPIYITGIRAVSHFTLEPALSDALWAGNGFRGMHVLAYVRGGCRCTLVESDWGIRELASCFMTCLLVL